MQQASVFSRMMTVALILFSVVTTGFFMARPGSAGFAAITLDGVRDAGYSTAIASDPSDDLAAAISGQAHTLWTDLTALYCANDDSFLYVYADLPAYSNSTASGEIGLLIEKGTAAGGATDPWGNAITYAHANLPDFAVRGNIAGRSGIPGDDNNGWTELRTWNGSNWNSGAGVNWGGLSGGGQVGSNIAYANSQGVEFKIPLSTLGLSSGQTAALEFYATQKGATRGAYDTTPSDDQATGLNDPTTLSAFATCAIESNGTPTNTPTTGPTPAPTNTSTAGPSPTPTPTAGTSCASAQVGDGAIVTMALYHNNTEIAWRDPVGGILPNGAAAVRLRTCHNDVQNVNILVWTTGAGVNPSFIYTPTVVTTDPNGPYDIWEYMVPGPGYNIDQWYQFRIGDGALLGHYHPSGGNTGPGVWVVSPNPVNPSWSLPTIPAPPVDYPVPSWLKDAVIYQIFPDRFRNGDPSNDIGGVAVYGPTTCNGYPGPGAPACVTEMHSSWTDLPRMPGYGIDFFGGDLQGIIDKINGGYFADLGVNTLYLNPIFAASSNHGYDTNDYYSINPRFGDNAIFDQFMAAANAHGLRVILDGVFNHAGSDSKYMDGYGLNRWPGDIGACEGPNPYRSWFTPGGNGSGCSDGWKWKGWYGYETIPEFVDASAEVRAFFYRDGSPQSPGGKSVTRYWLEKGIAGWRFDVAQDISHDWWRDMRPYVKTVYGDDEVLMLGEVTGGCYPYQDFVNAGELDSAMNYCFRDWVRDYANGGSPASFDASWQNFRSKLPPSPWYGMMNLISSHDSPRLLSQLNQDTNRLKLAIIMQMTLPGAPSVYYGDEVSLPGSGDPDNRRTYPWSDRGGNPDTNMYQHFKQLIGIRNQNPALRGGDMTTLLIDGVNYLYSYLRWDANAKIVVVLNNSGSAASGVIPVAAHLPDGAVLTDLLDGGAFTVTGGNLNITVPARWGRILHINLASTPTPTPTATGGPTATPTPTATATPTGGLPTATPTPTATGGPTATPTATPDGAVLVISPATVNATVGMTFTVTVRVLTNQSVDGAAAYLDFDPTRLQVMAVAHGATLPAVLQNSFDNNAGQVNFAAGILSAPFPATDFDLAQITFQALALTPGTPLTFASANPRMSDVSFGGASILDHAENGSVIIGASSATLAGAVTLQGRPAPPHARWSVPLTVSLTTPGSGTPAYTFNPTTDQNGLFTISGVTPGTYDVRVKHAHTLQNKITATLLSGPNTANLGVLREGDADNDNFVTLVDFSILASSFGVCQGAAAYDARADFDNDTCVTLVDFSLLATNFGQAGAGAPAGRAAPPPPANPHSVTLEIAPPTSQVRVGEPFTVTAHIETGLQQVDGVSVYLNFDPALLQVQAVTQPNNLLPLVIQNQFNNSVGTVDFAAGAFSGFPSGAFDVVQVRFQAQTITNPETPLAFEASLPRRTDATFGGQSVLNGATGGLVVAYCYDFDNSGLVDAADISAVASVWGAVDGGPLYVARYDVDHNGVIDVVDVMRVAARWNQPC